MIITKTKEKLVKNIIFILIMAICCFFKIQEQEKVIIEEKEPGNTEDLQENIEANA